MSEVAGRLAVQIGVDAAPEGPGREGPAASAACRACRAGASCVIGAGIVGINAVRVAHALGAEVDVLDVDLRRLTYLYDIFRGELNTLYSNRANLERSVLESDLVVGAVYVHGRRAPMLVTEKMVRGDGAGLGDRRRRGRPGRLRRDDPRRPPTPTRPTWCTA